MRERGRDNFFFHARAAFLPFLCTPAVTNFCWSFCLEIFRPSFCCFATVSGLCTLLLFQVCFCSVCSVQFSHFIRTTTNAHIIVLLYHREGRERERKRKVRNSSPLFRRIIIAKPVQQNKKEIERLRELHTNTEEENCVLYPIRREFLKRKDDPSVLFAVQI